MKFRKGIGVVDGIVIGEAFVLDAEHYRITQRFFSPRTREAAEAEWARFERAVAAAKQEVAAERTKLTDEGVANNVAAIMDFQAGLYDDPSVTAGVKSGVFEQFHTPEHALSRQLNRLRRQLEGLQLPRSHRGDFDDVERRLLKHLLGQKRETLRNLNSEVVLIARDLTPAQTAALPLQWVKGMATERGGQTSHTAIIAQSRRIPAVVGLNRISSEVTGGETVILDGREGRVIIDPDPATLAKYEKRRERYLRDLQQLEELLHLPAETRDGHLVKLFANIEYPDEIANALAQGAGGIGLYRTEFLYDYERPEPNEEDHFQAYTKAVKALDGRPLVIRTLDLGADKFRPEGLRDEENPFLGCRSIRYCLIERRDVFEAQLRAILRVASQGDVRIMLPMISSLEELRTAKAIVEDVRHQLRREGHQLPGQIPVGIMIEVPSAALMADVLARHADFFSIGTNDLVQYTLAVDRGNEGVAGLYQPTHPAIFRLILHTVEAARRHKIPVSICGELSGEPHFTLPLIGLGMRDLSMASSSIPRIKRFVRAISAREAGQAVDRVLGMEDATACLSYLSEQADKVQPDLYA